MRFLGGPLDGHDSPKEALLTSKGFLTSRLMIEDPDSKERTLYYLARHNPTAGEATIVEGDEALIVMMHHPETLCYVYESMVPETVKDFFGEESNWKFAGEFET